MQSVDLYSALPVKFFQESAALLYLYSELPFTASDRKRLLVHQSDSLQHIRYAYLLRRFHLYIRCCFCLWHKDLHRQWHMGASWGSPLLQRYTMSKPTLLYVLYTSDTMSKLALLYLLHTPDTMTEEHARPGPSPSPCSGAGLACWASPVPLSGRGGCPGRACSSGIFFKFHDRTVHFDDIRTRMKSDIVNWANLAINVDRPTSVCL